jgi:hypothetical protein
MKLKFIPLGKVFIHNGNQAVCVIMEPDKTCGDCIYNKRHDGCGSPFYCTPFNRKDKMNVKFILTK